MKTKNDLRNQMEQYCNYMSQFAADLEKAREADFDCIAEGGASHVMKAYYIRADEDQENMVRDGDDKVVDMKDIRYCSNCNLIIVFPRNIEGNVSAMPGIIAYYCCGFKAKGKCSMIYCISCSKEKISATSAFTEHSEEDKYLALSQDIYSASFLSFITDSSQIPP